MRCFNKVFFIGRLAADPENKKLEGDKVVTTFPLAVNRDWYADDDKPVDYFKVICWGNFAEFCATSLKKGMAVFVGGHLVNHSFEGKNGKKYVSEISMNDLNILTWPKEGKSKDNALPSFTEQEPDATMTSCS